MAKYLLIAAATSIAILCALLAWEVRRVEVVKAQIVALAGEAAALRAEAAQAKEARDVADAWARNSAAQAAGYADLREGVLRGGDDAPAPAVVLDVIGRLRTPR